MYYIATFYSHFGAIRFKRECRQEGREAQLMPVPRDLSSSCGTCVRCDGGYVEPKGVCADEVDVVVRVEDDGYHVVYGSKGE